MVITHAHTRTTCKPSDPDDCRYECVCGFGGSAESFVAHTRVDPVEDAIQRILAVLDNDEGGAELYEAACDLRRARAET